ncbi:MAG: DUF3192 domain-containing protein [Bryobacterales bacterium]
MRRLALAILLLLVAAPALAGDEVPYREFLARNAERSAKLTLGMKKDEVLAVMGDATSRVRDGNLSNPWKVEAFQKGEDQVEVLFYLVRKHPPFTAIRESQALAVVLRNGAVVAWGSGADREFR